MQVASVPWYTTIMPRIPYTVVFWVYDKDGEIVTSYPHKADAVAHAQRIGGTWRRGRY